MSALYWSTWETREVLPVLRAAVEDMYAAGVDTGEREALAEYVFDLAVDFIDEADDLDLAGARSNGFAEMDNALNYWQSCVIAKNYHKANAARDLVVWAACEYVGRS
jgi:hypothetical protein